MRECWFIKRRVTSFSAFKVMKAWFCCVRREKAMKKIGLIGGMSWESTTIYYQLLNRGARERLGGLHSADLLLRSYDFHYIERLQTAGDWDGLTQMIIDAGRELEEAGAECVLICSNTMHKMASEVQAAVHIPLLHIGDAIAHAIHESSSRRPLVLATRFVMEQDFYLGYLRERHGISAVVPEKQDRIEVHRVIYEELCRGKVIEASKQKYMRVIEKAVSDQNAPADGVIFGCTEIGLLMTPEEARLPAFDTTVLHVKAALRFAGY